MPGANCVFSNCGTNRREKYDGVGIFRISQRKSPLYSAWREDVISIIKKYRMDDETFKRQIEACNISICERHYKQDDIEFTSKGRKALVVGALPTINLPARSHQAKLAPARRPLTIVNQNAQNTTARIVIRILRSYVKELRN
ncbi:PREDICTED: uncharacterized protein LOC105844711 [Paramuricea clavata]|uniref:PREDICTED: uncharacterized protein LOC105844711 n=1 Tax=Paramuricea clavata TaxID=317549 RepID=A0A7D9END4_PARCT|nr:PREDICTED: uncharacterized protein LOC105844711 [Paramuricea clavata]